MEMFPYILMRIAHFPLAVLKDLEAPQTFDLTREVARCEAKVSAIKDSLSTALHASVAQQIDSKLQNQLLQLRRDIHNDRLQIPIDFDQLPTGVDGTCLELIQQYADAMNLRNRLIEQVQYGYEHEVDCCRKAMVRMADDESLQKVLLASSPSFYHQVQRYLRRDSESPTKKTLRTERTLWQYINRMTTKTSPFNAATKLAMAHVEGQEMVSPVKVEERPFCHSRVLLNNRFLRELKRVLLAHPDVKRHLSIALNPSLEQRPVGYCMLVQRAGEERIVHEAWTKTSKTIHSYLSDQGRRSMDDLLMAFSEISEIEKHVEGLIESGFLEVGHELSVIDPEWSRSWLSVLKVTAQRSPALKKALALIDNLSREMTRFQDLPSSKRQEGLQTMYDLFTAACKAIDQDRKRTPLERQLGVAGLQALDLQLQQALGRSTKSGAPTAKDSWKLPRSLTLRNMVYEDYYWSEQINMSQAALMPLIASLHRFYQKSRKTWFDRKREKVRRLYLEAVGDRASLSMLDFFEEYRDTSSTEDMPSTFEVAWKESRDTVIDYFRSSKPEASPGGHIHLSSRAIPNLSPAAEEGKSLNAFVQLFDQQTAEGLQTCMVVNTVNPGFGKWFSRFLPLFSPRMHELMQRWNLSLEGHNEIFAEIYDRKTSNTGIHPSLLPYQILYPESLNTLPREKQISIADLQVTCDEESQRLKLILQSTGQEVKVFYLCFNSLPGHSSMFNLLTLFTDTRMFSQGLLIDECNRRTKKGVDGSSLKDQAELFPRITIDDRVVIQRRHWKVDKKIVPYKNKTEDDWAYFLRVNIWREQHNIPRDVFVQLMTYATMRKVQKKEERHLAPDIHKPQFVSFSNPFSVAQLSRDLPKVEESLLIFEMLPGRRHGQPIGDRRYATEMIVQVQSKVQQDVLP